MKRQETIDIENKITNNIWKYEQWSIRNKGIDFCLEDEFDKMKGR